MKENKDVVYEAQQFSCRLNKLDFNDIIMPADATLKNSAIEKAFVEQANSVTVQVSLLASLFWG